MNSASQQGANDSWTLVVAMANNMVIGRGSELPWRLSSDLRRFKKMTMGQCLLMGRKTYESIGRPLPGRQTIVLSRRGDSAFPTEVSVVNDFSQVADRVEQGREIMVVGGAEIYQAALPRCGTIWLTRVLAEVDGDVFFPPVDWQQWHLESSERCDAGPKDEWPSEFQIWKRRDNP